MTLGGRPVIGRADEVREIADALAAAVAPVVVEGEPGVGKTTLWEHVVADATGRGARVLTARPASSDAVLGYAGLGDLLGDVFDEVSGALPAPQARALAVALLREDPAGAGPDRRAVAAAFLSALRVLARAGPVVVAVDDLQWLDPPSAHLLGYAARRLTGDPVAFLLARREDPERPSVDLGSAHVVPVGPLGLSAVHRLVLDRLGAPLPRPLLRRVHE